MAQPWIPTKPAECSTPNLEDATERHCDALYGVFVV